MPSVTAAVVCSGITSILTTAGIPSVHVMAEQNESGEEDTGAFSIRSEYGFLKLYLPADLLQAYEHDDRARQKVSEAVSSLVIFLRRR